MKRIALTDQLKTELHGLHGPVHLCDDDGYLLATIEPVATNGSASSLVAYSQELGELLGNISSGVEFADQSGVIVGRIAPCTNPCSPHPGAANRLDDFKQRRAEGIKSITTAELVERLRNG